MEEWQGQLVYGSALLAEGVPERRQKFVVCPDSVVGLAELVGSAVGEMARVAGEGGDNKPVPGQTPAHNSVAALCGVDPDAEEGMGIHAADEDRSGCIHTGFAGAFDHNIVAAPGYSRTDGVADDTGGYTDMVVDRNSLRR